MDISDVSCAPILLVENDPDDAFFARRLLLKAEVRNPIVLMEDGEQALSFLQDSLAAGVVPMAMLLDIKMPRVDGFEVLRWVRGQRAFIPMRVAMLSSSDAPSDRQQAKALGADAYLVKYPAPAAIAALLEDKMDVAGRR